MIGTWSRITLTHTVVKFQTVVKHLEWLYTYSPKFIKRNLITDLQERDNNHQAVIIKANAELCENVTAGCTFNGPRFQDHVRWRS